MLVMVAIILYFQLPLWYLIPIGLISYFGSVTLTILAKSRPDEEDEDANPLLLKLHEDLKAGRLEAGSEEMFNRMRECGIVDVYPIGEVSETILGSFNGNTIYEWVEVQEPETQEMFKFYYHSPGQYELDGTPILPEKEGVLFAHVDGIVYARDE